jgi:diaminopimelate epimerase
LGGDVRFAKYHALGNDYLVLDAAGLAGDLTPAQVRRICDRRYGIGSDGLLVGSFRDPEDGISVRCFNPDGGEFEKTGNGLRIYARYLWDEGWVQENEFTIETLGGQVRARVHPAGRQVTVEMGTVSFDSRLIPVTGPPREVLHETLSVEGQSLPYCAATVGNPHCVVLCDDVSAEKARRWGPQIENDPRFPKRTNVQFMQVLDRANIRIEIWERGVGYTLASGSSSCAAAAVAHRLGWCDSNIGVHQPGGKIEISILDGMTVSMTGPVSKICDGVLSAEMLDEAGRTVKTG